jgi:phospholipase/carboxylesterase
VLTTEVHAPPGAGDGTPVVILMHGRGADLTDLVPLRGRFPDGVALVFPRAPHPGAPWGYGPGWAWYRYEGGDRPETASFRSSQESLGELREGLPGLLGFEPGPVVHGGFSQGGTMALGYALQNPGAAAGVLNFSGFVPAHPDVEVTAANVAGTPFWWGHGTRDPSVRYELARRGRAALEQAGADLEVRDYPMGHGIVAQELEDAVSWLRGRVPAAAG